MKQNIEHKLYSCFETLGANSGLAGTLETSRFGFNQQLQFTIPGLPKATTLFMIPNHMVNVNVSCKLSLGGKQYLILGFYSVSRQEIQLAVTGQEQGTKYAQMKGIGMLSNFTLQVFPGSNINHMGLIACAFCSLVWLK